VDSRFTPAPNADTRRATSLQCPPRRLRLANGSSPGSAAMPARFGDGSDCVYWRGDRITCVRWPADSTTLFCIVWPSPTGHCARRRWLRDLSRSTDAQSLRASWKATLKVDCPYCGAVHEISVREAYIDSAIHAATDRLDRVYSTDGPFRPSAKVVGAKELPLRAKLVPTDERRRQVKKPKWLPWESSDKKSDDLKKVRRQTDQRMKQQEAQKEERERNRSRPAQ
jgi:hypothetical protein